jgi:predicted outer membrane protein
MTKRPSIDLKALTTEQAAPMQEAVQRLTKTPSPEVKLPKSLTQQARVKTENLEPLAFKVPPDFDKRFRRRAFDADLYLNELLFEALDAWEEKHGLRK